MRTIFLTLFCLFLFQYSHAQTVVGKWKTVDDATQKTKSIVEIYKKGGLLYGKILKIYPEPGEPKDPICDLCPGAKKDKKIIGMEIITALKKDGDKWKKDDAILDPENGKNYDCKLWLKDKNTIAVRGYIGFFYRTQYWIRVTAP